MGIWLNLGMLDKRKRKQLTRLLVVVSVYNEAEGLENFHRELIKQLGKMGKIGWRVAYVDDGSSDGSEELLTRFAKRSRRVGVVHLARNYGHEAAMMAGIDRASNEAVVCLDADLQHPPRWIPRMIDQLGAGADVVIGKRKNNAGDLWWRGWLTELFYRGHNLLNSQKLEPRATDFFMVSSRVVSLLQGEYGERQRFVRAILQTLGFECVFFEFKVPRRKWGKSKYSVVTLFELSMKSLLIFSPFGLQICLIASAGFSVLSVGVLVFSVVMKFLLQPVPGYTTLIVFVSGLAAVQFLVLAIVANYLSVLVHEAKRRPIYVVKQEVGIKSVKMGKRLG